MTCPYCADVHDAATGVGQGESARPRRDKYLVAARLRFSRDAVAKPTAEEAIDSRPTSVIQANF
jgi:hypothetical protein